MEEDDLVKLPAEILEDLRAKGWRFFSAGLDAVLLEEARDSARRAAEASQAGGHRREWGAVAAAILCASAACEARVSEYLAHWEAVSGPLPADLAAIRGKSDALEQWRLLLRSRAPDYDLARSREHQHLGCLIRLRDVVAHRNARLRLVGRVPEQLADCSRQGILPLREAGGGEWPSVVLVHAVAAWAVDAASRWLSIANELMPLRC